MSGCMGFGFPFASWLKLSLTLDTEPTSASYRFCDYKEWGAPHA